MCYEVEGSLCFDLNCEGQNLSPGEHFRISFYQEKEQVHFSAQDHANFTLYHHTYISE